MPKFLGEVDINFDDLWGISGQTEGAAMPVFVWCVQRGLWNITLVTSTKVAGREPKSLHQEANESDVINPLNTPAKLWSSQCANHMETCQKSTQCFCWVVSSIAFLAFWWRALIPPRWAFILTAHYVIVVLPYCSAKTFVTCLWQVLQGAMGSVCLNHVRQGAGKFLGTNSYLVHALQTLLGLLFERKTADKHTHTRMHVYTVYLKKYMHMCVCICVNMYK